jgi:hypothetical protein
MRVDYETFTVLPEAALNSPSLLSVLKLVLAGS